MSHILYSFRPVLKSVIFLSVSTILVCFTTRPIQQKPIAPKRSYINENTKQKGTNVAENERTYSGFYPGSERYNIGQTRKKRVKKRNQSEMKEESVRSDQEIKLYGQEWKEEREREREIKYRLCKVSGGCKVILKESEKERERDMLRGKPWLKSKMLRGRSSSVCVLSNRHICRSRRCNFISEHI